MLQLVCSEKNFVDTLQSLVDMYCFSRYNKSKMHLNNIALMQLNQPVTLREASPIHICAEDPELGEVLGACGMGSLRPGVSTRALPDTLQVGESLN